MTSHERMIFDLYGQNHPIVSTQQQLDAKAAEMAKFAEMYKNPFINAAITFVEPLPVGLLITLVCAGILSRKRKESSVPAVARASAAT